MAGELPQRPELDQLLRSLATVSINLLTKHGPFPPHGECIARDGGRVPVAAYLGQDEKDPQRWVAYLEHSLKELVRTEGHCAAGFFAMVEVEDPRTRQRTDAILVSLEHESGDAMDVYFPYTQGPEIKFTQGFGLRRAPRIFVQAGTP